MLSLCARWITDELGVDPGRSGPRRSRFPSCAAGGSRIRSCENRWGLGALSRVRNDGVGFALPHVVRRWLFLLTCLAACQPFGRDDTPVAESEESEDTSAEPKKKKKTSTDAPPESTSTTMPTEPPAALCAGAIFCDDFEAGERGNGLWEGFDATGPDAIVRGAPSAGPGSFSLGFDVAPTFDSPVHSALRRSLGEHDRVTLTFALQIPASFGDTGHSNLAHLDFGYGGDEEIVLVIVGTNDRVGLVTRDRDRNYELVNDVPIAPGTWHEVKLFVDLPSDPPTSRLTIDGKDVVTSDELSISFDQPPPVHLTLGPDYKDSPAAFGLRYDDVRVDAQDTK